VVTAGDALRPLGAIVCTRPEAQTHNRTTGERLDDSDERHRAMHAAPVANRGAKSVILMPPPSASYSRVSTIAVLRR